MKWLALGLAVCFNVSANVSFKLAMAGRDAPLQGLGIKAVLANAWLWVGGVSCIFLLASYLYALRGLGLGTTYAMVTSLALIFVSIFSSLLFGEHFGFTKSLGIVAVILGIFLIVAGEPAIN